MKKIFYVILGIVLLGTSGCLSLTASMKKRLAKIENEYIDMETVEDGIFEGHSELDPVKVDVKVLVKNHKLIKVELLRHECGLGHPLDVIVDKMVEGSFWVIKLCFF